MASAEQQVAFGSLIKLKRALDLRSPKPVVKIIVEHPANTIEAGKQGRFVFDLSHLRLPGSCSIGVEGLWRVSLPKDVVREALRRSGNPDAEPVTGQGTYRRGNEATEETFSLKVTRPAEGLVAVSFSGAPTFGTLSDKVHGHDFGRIPETTMLFGATFSTTRYSA